MMPIDRNDDLSAQSIACGYLVRAGEQALSELELDLATAEADDKRALLERSAVVLAELLADWRESLLMLRAATGSDHAEARRILLVANSR
jgi:hypothetical protein